MKCHLMSIRMDIIIHTHTHTHTHTHIYIYEIWDIASEGEDMEKGNSATHLLRGQIGVATVNYSMEVPQNIRNKLPYGPAISLLDIYSKEWNHFFEEISAPSYSVYYTLYPTMWEQSECPLTGECSKKIYTITHMTGYLPFSHKRMKPCHLHGWTWRVK